jgi:hypothetical protein
MKIIVVATPKAGSHWLKELLAEIYGLSLVSVGEIETAENAICHDHILPHNERLKWLSDHEIIPITILRHPGTVLLSLYQSVWRKSEPLPGEQSILRDIDGPSAGTLAYARVHLYSQLMVSDLWRLAGARYVHYEDLVADPLTTLEGLTSAMRPATTESLRRATLFSHLSLERLRLQPDPGRKADSSLYRGDGVNSLDELTPDILALLSAPPFLEYMRELGYEPNMEDVIPFDIARIDPFKGHEEFTNGARLSPEFQRLLLTTMPELISWPRPWEVSNEECLYSWLNAPERIGARLTNLMRLIYSVRGDLQSAYPDVDASPRDFQIWFLAHASKEYDFGPEFLAPARNLLAEAATGHTFDITPGSPPAVVKTTRQTRP